MKVPARRRGNIVGGEEKVLEVGLNESPRPKAGKLMHQPRLKAALVRLNESPRPKAGKFHTVESHSLPGDLPQ